MKSGIIRKKKILLPCHSDCVIMSLRGAAGDAAISKTGLLHPFGVRNDTHFTIATQSDCEPKAKQSYIGIARNDDLLNAFVLVTLMLLILITPARANEELRDPFVSLGDKLVLSQGPAEAVRLPYPIILKGTLCAKNSLVAIVNNDIIKEGEEWQDFYVVKIEKGLVILEWRNKKFEIRLAPEKEIMPSEKISGKYVPSQPERKIRPK